MIEYSPEQVMRAAKEIEKRMMNMHQTGSKTLSVRVTAHEDGFHTHIEDWDMQFCRDVPVIPFSIVIRDAKGY